MSDKPDTLKPASCRGFAVRNSTSAHRMRLAKRAGYTGQSVLSCVGMFVSLFVWPSLTTMAQGSNQEGANSALIANVPEKSQWTVTIRNLSDKAREKEAAAAGIDISELDSAPAPIEMIEARQVTNSYARGVRREVVVDRKGNRYENYIADGRLMFDHPATGEAMIFGSGAELVEDSGSMGRLGEFLAGYSTKAGVFGEFSWLSRKHYVGEATIREKACQVYQQSRADHRREQLARAPELGDDGNPIPQTQIVVDTKLDSIVERTAYVDMATKLPVRLETHAYTRDYEFGKLTESISVPARFVEILRERQERARKFHQRYATPN